MSFFLNDYLISNGINLRKRVSDLFDELEKNPELAQRLYSQPHSCFANQNFPRIPKI